MRSLAGWILSITILTLSSGCTPSAPSPTPTPMPATGGDSHAHEHADPKSFAEGLAELKEHGEAIASAFVKDAPESAHETAHHALHDVGRALEALEKFGKELTLPDDEKAKVMEAVKKLFEVYGNIDGAIHDGKEVKYDEMKDAIKQAMDTLSAVKS